MEEKQITETESLELIASMINKVKSNYHESGISALLWGSVIIFCSLVTLGNVYWRIGWLSNVWWLTFAAIIPQVIISIKESRQRKFKTHTTDAMSGIWTSFGIAMVLLSVYDSRFPLPHAAVLYLMLFGMPTFATGMAHRFKPMILGGLVCWLLAIVSLFINNDIYQLIFFGVAAFFAWLLPGIILRTKYVKAKRQYV